TLALCYYFYFFVVTAQACSRFYTLSLHDALPISTNPASTASVTDVNKIGISFVAFNAPKALGVELAKIKSTLSATKLSKIVLTRSEEHTSELQSRFDLVCRLLLEKKNKRA